MNHVTHISRLLCSEIFESHTELHNENSAAKVTFFRLHESKVRNNQPTIKQPHERKKKKKEGIYNSLGSASRTELLSFQLC